MLKSESKFNVTEPLSNITSPMSRTISACNFETSLLSEDIAFLIVKTIGRLTERISESTGPRSLSNRCVKDGESVISALVVVLEMVDTFLNTDFEGGRHQNRINKIQPC